ncbi:hypothetical protein DKX38_016024 [Salix brachista]|uniref:Uncharacterized protein n=1 Tax=Salix brachista TaxID=2182728 RepID=A0A5N5L8W9_9ROSI|nr:hypothetical protein DKX38_016024 [Salix brachista]
MMDSYIQEEKNHKLEKFVNGHLKLQLVRAITEWDKVFEQQKILSDTQRMFVDFGLGFHVEFTWSEALNFIALREEKRARFGNYTNCSGIFASPPCRRVCVSVSSLILFSSSGNIKGVLYSLSMGSVFCPNLNDSLNCILQTSTLA